jgi:hypothetical protein
VWGIVLDLIRYLAGSAKLYLLDGGVASAVLKEVFR